MYIHKSEVQIKQYIHMLTYLKCTPKYKYTFLMIKSVRIRNKRNCWFTFVLSVLLKTWLVLFQHRYYICFYLTKFNFYFIISYRQLYQSTYLFLNCLDLRLANSFVFSFLSLFSDYCFVFKYGGLKTNCCI